MCLLRSLMASPVASSLSRRKSTGGFHYQRFLIMISKFVLSSLVEEVNGAAEVAGSPNISYCASIDLGDAFPAVIQLGMLIEGSGGDCYPLDALLDTLRFLAQNGRFFPSSLGDASLEDFKVHLIQHADEIFEEIENDAKSYRDEYEDEERGCGDEAVRVSCPFCESSEVSVDETDGRRCCDECGRLFDDDDIRREELRHRLSPRLADTSEDEPMVAMVPVGEDGRVVESIFQFEDGTIWYRLLGDSEYQDIDTLSIGELEKVLNVV